MLELYHYDHSTAAQEIRIALAEKQLEWESHHLDTSVAKREHFLPEYLNNPRGVVPTLVHDGKVIGFKKLIWSMRHAEFYKGSIPGLDISISSGCQ